MVHGSCGVGARLFQASSTRAAKEARRFAASFFPSSVVCHFKIARSFMQQLQKNGVRPVTSRSETQSGKC